MSGPLAGLKVIELSSIGPAPFCAMMLGDMGADVIRIERDAAGGMPPARDPLLRNRRSVSLNLKCPEGVETLLLLVDRSDVLIEGYRPGVVERLGVGPDICLKRNSRLIYGRMTGWGQHGPLASTAGHDINYIALTGALHLIGRPCGKPTPPLNLVGDFGGGGMLLLCGVLAALLEMHQSGRGQVVDAAMVDGTVALMGMMFAFRANSYFRDAPGENLFAGAAPFYDTYETLDGKYVSIGSLEPPFNSLLLEKLGLSGERIEGLNLATVNDAEARARWPELRAILEKTFKTHTRDEWCRLLEGTDVCFAPVLTLEEAPRHPHNLARQTFIEVEGVVQNAPAPRFSRTSLESPNPGRLPGEDTQAVLMEAGLSPSEIQRLQSVGAINLKVSIQHQ